MKLRMIFTALVLPCVTAAQQPAEKVNTETDPPTNVIQNSFQLYTPLTNKRIMLPEQLKVRVNLNLMNAPLKEAVKQLTDQTKQVFVLEKDVPANARVTVVAKNISLDTALNTITESASLHWNRQSTILPLHTYKKPPGRADTVDVPTGKDVGLVIHIGKNLSPDLLRWSNVFPVDPFFQNNNLYRWNAQDKNFQLNYRELLNKDGSNFKQDDTFQFKKVPSIQGDSEKLHWTAPHIESLNGQPPLLSNKPSDLSATYTLGNTLLGTTSVSEVRSTFTCPHCKQQVTVIHKHESPKCEKCGRTFRDDWQFCPFDGAKRTATAGTDWQFCPICGKSVKGDGKAETKDSKDGSDEVLHVLVKRVKDDSKAEKKGGN